MTKCFAPIEHLSRCSERLDFRCWGHFCRYRRSDPGSRLSSSRCSSASILFLPSEESVAEELRVQEWDLRVDLKVALYVVEGEKVVPGGSDLVVEERFGKVDLRLSRYF
jgi:hypothetical protein